jgi:hypothetical protein
MKTKCGKGIRMLQNLNKTALRQRALNRGVQTLGWRHTWRRTQSHECKSSPNRRRGPEWSVTHRKQVLVKTRRARVHSKAVREKATMVTGCLTCKWWPELESTGCGGLVLRCGRWRKVARSSARCGRRPAKERHPGMVPWCWPWLQGMRRSALWWWGPAGQHL